jgi:hypothetical protein
MRAASGKVHEARLVWSNGGAKIGQMAGIKDGSTEMTNKQTARQRAVSGI